MERHKYRGILQMVSIQLLLRFYDSLRFFTLVAQPGFNTTLVKVLYAGGGFSAEGLNSFNTTLVKVL